MIETGRPRKRFLYCITDWRGGWIVNCAIKLKKETDFCSISFVHLHLFKMTKILQFIHLYDKIKTKNIQSEKGTERLLW